VGVGESQQPGRYGSGASDASEAFGVVNRNGSLKPFFFAPEKTLLELHSRANLHRWRVATRTGRGLQPRAGMTAIDSVSGELTLIDVTKY
jgi:hypothetical protein